MQPHVHTRAVPFPISPDISFNSKLVRLEVNADERILRLNPEFQFQTGAIRISFVNTVNLCAYDC